MLNEAYRLLVYTYDLMLLEENINTIFVLFVAISKVVLQVYGVKTENIFTLWSACRTKWQHKDSKRIFRKCERLQISGDSSNQ
jgi:hypothetical protein